MSVVRVGDLFGMGGIVLYPATSSVTVNGRPVATFGALYTPHLGCTPKTPQHCVGMIFDAPAGVTMDGQIPLTKGAIGICGHSPTTASDDVIIVGGGFGVLGLALSLGLGQIDFGTSDLGGLASGFAGATAPITSALENVSSTVSSSVGGGAFGRIVGGAARSFVTSLATSALRSATSVAAGGRPQSLSSALTNATAGAIAVGVTGVINGAASQIEKKITSTVRTG